MKLLGISCYYHDSAACLVDEGRIVAAAQEERFTRKKHDAGFPFNAVRYCLAEGGGRRRRRRLLRQAAAQVPPHPGDLPRGRPPRPALGRPGHPALAQGEALDPAADRGGPGALRRHGGGKDIYFAEHHESHAASAYYPSPFEEAAVLTLDGVGEWATTTIGVGEGNRLRLIREIAFPHSLGLLYSAFTYFTGFKVNSGEYKLMGLAPYGAGVYTDLIKRELVDIREDGSFRLNMDYFGYMDGLEMTNGRFAELFGGPPRQPESPISKREMDLARSIQEVTEEIVLKLARHAREITGKRNLCLAGGVALNCVANGILLREGIFDDIWIQPAAGDAGGALGAPLAVWHNAMDKPRTSVERRPRTPCAARCSAPSSRTTRPRPGSTATAIPTRSSRRKSGRSGSPQLIAVGERDRPLPGADGVRPAGARRPLDRRRRALAQDAVDHEPEDQVPGELPAVRAERAGRAGLGLLRARPAVALHAAGGGRGRAAARARSRGTSRTCRSSSGSTGRARTCPRSPTSTTRRASRP